MKIIFFQFWNYFQGPAEIPNSTAGTKFVMRTWEPKTINDYTDALSSEVKGKWHSLYYGFEHLWRFVWWLPWNY
nr:hypothetical protein [Mycoplasmopsis bovis]